jgi:hypothetical protein
LVLGFLEKRIKEKVEEKKEYINRNTQKKSKIRSQKRTSFLHRPFTTTYLSSSSIWSSPSLSGTSSPNVAGRLG